MKFYCLDDVCGRMYDFNIKESDRYRCCKSCEHANVDCFASPDPETGIERLPCPIMNNDICPYQIDEDEYFIEKLLEVEEEYD